VNWPRITLLFTLAALLVIAVFDVVAIDRGGYPATISYLALHAATERPVIALAVGILVGHLFWSVPAESSRVDRALLVVGLLALAGGAAAYAAAFTVPPIVACVAGLPLGRLLWGQPAPKRSP
jgi:hypothetical protein